MTIAPSASSFNRFIARMCLAAALLAPLIALPICPANAGDAAVREFQRAAYSADFRNGVANLQAMAAADPSDVEAVFGTGTLQFFHALANLQEGFYRYGGGRGMSNGAGLGILGLFPRRWRRSAGGFPLLPLNPDAIPMTYQALRNILERFADDLKAAEATLAKVGERPVKLPLQPFNISADLNHDGEIADAESLMGMIMAIDRPGRRRGRTSDRQREIAEATIVFDTADASWLRGYSNLLMASANLALAFDFEKSYEAAAHNVYGPEATAFGRELVRQAPERRDPAVIQAEYDAVTAEMNALIKPQQDRRKLKALRKQLRELGHSRETKEERELLREELTRLNKLRNDYYKKRGELGRDQRRLRNEKNGRLPSDTFAGIADLVAYVHTMSWAVVEPDRLRAVRRHLLRVAQINKTTWRLVRAETDNDREWLPNSAQTTPFGGRRITDKVIDGWLATMALGEQVLNGEKLLPHPRFKKGINLAKFFDTATRVDFVLLVTGHGVLPYLEEGDVVDRKAWRAITGPLGREFPLYAIWFN